MERYESRRAEYEPRFFTQLGSESVQSDSVRVQDTGLSGEWGVLLGVSGLKVPTYLSLPYLTTVKVVILTLNQSCRRIPGAVWLTALSDHIAFAFAFTFASASVLTGKVR